MTGARPHIVRLAEATELSHPFPSQIERGLAQPSLGSLRRTAVALETSPIERIAAADDHATAASVVASVCHRGGVAHRWWSGDGRSHRMLVVTQGGAAPRTSSRGAAPRQAGSAEPRAL